MIETLYDVVNMIEWDTLKVPMGWCLEVGSTDLFVEPIGKNKTRLDTSMICAGVLPLPCHRMVHRIQLIWSQDNNPKDNKLFKKLASWEFVIGMKVFANGPVAMFQNYDEVSDLEQLLNQVKIAKELGFNIAGSFVDVRLGGKDDAGLHILQQQNFKFTFNLHERFRPLSDFKLIVALDGPIARGIQ